LHERLSWQLLILAIFGTWGTIIATTPNLDTHSVTSTLAGNALIVAGVVCAALYNIYTQRQLANIEPLRLVSLHQLSGLALVIAIWLIRLPITGLFIHVSSSDFFLALVSGTTQYALSFWLYLAAIKDLGAARSSILLILPPVFTIWGSFVFLKEQLNSWQWVGVFIALAAVSRICLSKTQVIEEP
jgi:drug/metabolite transporter (DMT)-like permease